MAAQRRVRARIAKPAHDQNMRNLEEQVEALDEQLDEIEARRVVQGHIDDQHAIKKNLRRKMH